MPLQPFSTRYVDERFRIKIAFDTNILMYLLDNAYPNLNLTVSTLRNYSDFVDLITNRYAIFELYEKRKETHFMNCASSLGLLDKINSDKFYVDDIIRYQRLFSTVFSKRLFGASRQKKIFQFLKKYFSIGQHGGDGLFFSNISAIGTATKLDIPRIKNDFGIELEGSIHDNLWNPTFELILSSRISREDSLIASAFIQPESGRVEKNLILLTNDGDFATFYKQAQEKGFIAPLFTALNWHEPSIIRITQLKTLEGSLINLRNPLINDLNEHILSFLKSHIIENNKAHFLGFTEPDILPQSKNMIGLKIKGEAQYHANQNLMIIGSNLDFIYTIPNVINEFRKKDSTQIDFPLREIHKLVCYKHVPLAANDPDIAHEPQIISALKTRRNLVFVHPDT